MASKPLSKHQQNFVQLGIVCVDEIKLVLKNIFESQIKPTDLYYVINSCSELTTGRHKLRPEQLRLCSLSPPQIPDYDQFDVSLLYTLIRNLCPNLKPTKGWGKTPDSTDTKIGDDIERLRIFRNDMFAHVESSEVPDPVFLQCWNDLKGNIHRAQKFVTLLGYKVNYEEKLANIENFDFGRGAMEKYKLLLEGMMILWKQSQITGKYYIIHVKILCEEKACFEAETENFLDTDNWPIKWIKVRGDTTKTIDISKEKYNGSTSRRLVISKVLKKDQGEYQAVISREIDRRHVKIESNTLFLEVIGDLPNLEINRAMSWKDSITIFYNCNAEKVVPSLKKIEWSKNGKCFRTKLNKYRGGGVTDTYLKILSSSENDSGEYKCEVSNAVGSVSKVIFLDAPFVKIGKDLTVENCQILTATFGDQVTISAIVKSCPSPIKAIWQKSKDQTPDNFMTVDIDHARYFGSSLEPAKPILVITKASDADKVYYRLEVTNGIGKSISNNVLLKLVGDLPSVSTHSKTDFLNQSVIFSCDIFLSDYSTYVTDVVWTKDEEKIDIASSGGKYDGGNLANPLLVINKGNITNVVLQMLSGLCAVIQLMW
ncbi:uncharacterized protein LOC134240371, partial [Saccostrea cucullata]|uniref:uncharacterized protein LOC134240371 n=1 Tax=Saccostrea cuccullata TaxID=36930 RepID=UPI002ED341D6